MNHLWFFKSLVIKNQTKPKQKIPSYGFRNFFKRMRDNNNNNQIYFQSSKFWAVEAYSSELLFPYRDCL